MLLLENISLKFDSELIIDKFNLDISEGEHICLWGPSGSGKTSVLKLIMGMASPSDGHIYFNDKMVDENNI
ncbi:MAG: ATP-binding cassette domain-containing protein [Saprospiraceae bacterium]|nr:ATP-binding cassette domain-containing protein [Saprospiraceae bacterium]